MCGIGPDYCSACSCAAGVSCSLGGGEPEVFGPPYHGRGSEEVCGGRGWVGVGGGFRIVSEDQRSINPHRHRLPGGRPRVSFDRLNFLSSAVMGRELTMFGWAVRTFAIYDPMGILGRPL